jgi:hypothetical protein
MSDGGFLDAVADFGADLFDDVVDAGFDAVSSFTDSFGTEFLTDFSFDSIADSFTTAIGDVAGSLYETVGSFAGDGAWFDAFNPGSIIDSAITSVTDFAGNITSGITLPSVGSLLSSATGLNPSIIPGFGSGGLQLPSLGSVINVPGLVNSAVANITNIPGRLVSGVINTGTNLVNSTISNLVGPIAQPIRSLTTGTGFGINTGYGSLPISGIAGPLNFGTNLVDSTISNLTRLPGQVVGGIINTGTQAVNATLSGLVGTATAAVPGGSIIRAATGVDPNIVPGIGSAVTSQITSAGRVNTAVPVSVPSNFGEVFNPETGLYDIYDFNNPDTPVLTGLTQQAAILAAQDLGIGSNSAIVLNTGTNVDPGNFPAYDDDGNLLPGYELDGDENPVFVGFGPTRTNAADVNLANFPGYDDDGNLLPGYTLDEDNNPVFIGNGFVEPSTQALADAGRAAALRDQARQQQTIRDQRQNKAQSGDWRVRLRLAPSSTYLYNAADCGPVLQPLRVTDGVIFPYTPNIDMAYKANYSQYDLTHSNYRGYFYQSSAIDAINLKATFTAQDTAEANYLLAVIHFFRSVTKMFYGQDAERGSPPPMTYLSGLGDFQFNEHPCLVSQFNYSLPSDVDYIRAQVSPVNGQNLLRQRDRQTIAGNPLSYALQRLASVGLTKGALDDRFAAPTLGITTPTYVPTKMEIQLTLLPTQSRQQVSKQFSVKNFANGNLLKGGFW